MGFYEFIEKTLARRRGYKYHTYQTEIDGDIFKLYHYGVKILEVNLRKRKILDYLITSFSDAQAISKTLYELKWCNHYFLEGHIIYRKEKGFYFDALSDWKKLLRKLLRIGISPEDLSYRTKIKLAEKVEELNEEELKEWVERSLKISRSLRKQSEYNAEMMEKLEREGYLNLDNAIVILSMDRSNYYERKAYVFFKLIFDKFFVISPYFLKFKKNCVFLAPERYSVVELREDILKELYIDLLPLIRFSFYDFDENFIKEALVIKL